MIIAVFGHPGKGERTALPQRLQSAFVTEDRRLLKAFPSIARTMQETIAG